MSAELGVRLHHGKESYESVNTPRHHRLGALGESNETSGTARQPPPLDSARVASGDDIGRRRYISNLGESFEQHMPEKVRNQTASVRIKVHPTDMTIAPYSSRVAPPPSNRKTSQEAMAQAKANVERALKLQAYICDRTRAVRV